MKKRIIYMAALAAMAAASCTALEERAVLEQEPLDAVSRSITPEEALDNLDCLIAELYDGTKSGIPTYDPANLTVYGGIATKSDGEPLPDTTLYIINFTRVMETQHLYHINWGWAGDCDGYFHQGVFDTAQCVEIDDTTDPGTSDMNGCSYGWLFRSVVYSL